LKRGNIELILKEKGEELRAEQLFWWKILRKVTKNLISWLKKQLSMQDRKTEGVIVCAFSTRRD
jgi:hypothetical protein